MLLDKTRTVKIADFGVARVEASNPNDMTGETGTLGYMAPEVCTFRSALQHLGALAIKCFLFDSIVVSLIPYMETKELQCQKCSYQTHQNDDFAKVIALFWLQVLNGNPYNRKCDVYSFGICLWEIYCCDMPYPDLSFSEVTSAVVRQVDCRFFHP